MLVKLRDACEIQVGYTLRGKFDAVVTGGVRAIQLRDVSPDGLIAAGELSRLNLDEPANRYLAGPGDVLFRSRGERNIAVALDERFGDPALAILPLFILRPKRQLVDPNFLAWSLNQGPAQRQIDASAQGQSLRMISRSSLDQLEIHVPDLQTQRIIIQVDALAERERLLAISAAEKRRDLINLILIDKACKPTAMLATEGKTR